MAAVSAVYREAPSSVRDRLIAAVVNVAQLRSELAKAERELDGMLANGTHAPGAREEAPAPAPHRGGRSRVYPDLRERVLAELVTTQLQMSPAQIRARLRIPKKHHHLIQHMLGTLRREDLVCRVGFGCYEALRE
jgi:hypothetical protein